MRAGNGPSSAMSQFAIGSLRRRFLANRYTQTASANFRTNSTFSSLTPFGVLNVGETSIPGACECIDTLRANGKHVAILTNAATVPLPNLEQKYAELGFVFAPSELLAAVKFLAVH